MRLSKLFKNAPTVNITGLCFDSRKVKKGNVHIVLLDYYISVYLD